MTSETAEDLRKLLYPETYFVGLAPAELRLALLSRGFALPASKPLRYLELGFGTGFSINVHAAANDGEFWGNDFVREHVDGAASVAGISGANLHLLPDAFSDLLTRDDLPMFDIVAAHGIWTWVADEDRAAIVELLKRKLAPGGALYVSYNNTAGWSSVVFLRQMMNLFISEAGGKAEIKDAVAFARSLQGANAAYFKENPTAAAELSMMLGRDPLYLRHEYFVRDWKLMSVAELEQALKQARLQFGAQFPLIMHDDELVLGPRGQELLAATKSAILRETVREAFQGMGFRQDIFVKDATKLSAEERRDHFRRQSFLMTARPRSVMLKGPSPWGDLDLGAKGCVPVMEALAALGDGPHTLAAVEEALPSIPIDDLISRIILLAAVKVVRPALPPEERKAVAPRCAALNAYILSLPGGSSAILASPVLGAGVDVSPLERAMLAAYAAGKRTIAECAEEIVHTCSAELRGRSAQDVATTLYADHFPFFREMGLASE